MSSASPMAATKGAAMPATLSQFDGLPMAETALLAGSTTSIVASLSATILADAALCVTGLGGTVSYTVVNTIGAMLAAEGVIASLAAYAAVLKPYQDQQLRIYLKDVKPYTRPHQWSKRAHEAVKIIGFPLNKLGYPCINTAAALRLF